MCINSDCQTWKKLFNDNIVNVFKIFVSINVKLYKLGINLPILFKFKKKQQQLQIPFQQQRNDFRQRYSDRSRKKKFTICKVNREGVLNALK